MKKWLKLILTFVISVVLACIYAFCQTNFVREISCILFGLIAPYVAKYLVDITDIEDWQSDFRKLSRAGVLKPDDFVRISFAYLFRIEIDGEYFLVKNDRGTKKYQPVGGVYICSDIEKSFLRQQMNVADDDKIPIDKSSRKDYRMRVPIQSLKKFVKRFSNEADRESLEDLSREFKEELIESGILLFEELSYKYCGRHSQFGFSRHFQCYELIIADVLQVELNKEQRIMLEHLKNESSRTEKYGFFTEKEIRSCGVEQGSGNLEEIIGDHSFKILQTTAVKLLRGDKKARMQIKKHKNSFTINLSQSA